MSKVMQSGEKKIKYVTVSEVVGIKCDSCGKVIPTHRNTYRDDRYKYYDVMTGHSDWGNDSCDSIEHHDICPDCLISYIENYFENGRDTAYLNVDTEYATYYVQETNGTYIEKKEENND